VALNGEVTAQSGPDLCVAMDTRPRIDRGGGQIAGVRPVGLAVVVKGFECGPLTP